MPPVLLLRTSQLSHRPKVGQRATQHSPEKEGSEKICSPNKFVCGAARSPLLIGRRCKLGRSGGHWTLPDYKGCRWKICNNKTVSTVSKQLNNQSSSEMEKGSLVNPQKRCLVFQTPTHHLTTFLLNHRHPLIVSDWSSCRASSAGRSSRRSSTGRARRTSNARSRESTATDVSTAGSRSASPPAWVEMVSTIWQSQDNLTIWLLKWAPETIGLKKWQKHLLSFFIVRDAKSRQSIHDQSN